MGSDRVDGEERTLALPRTRNEGADCIKAIRVLYIMGCGRSGSTILDILLGSSSSATSAGELINLNRNGWTDKRYCSCGEEWTDCPHWKQVREEFDFSLGEAQFNKLVQLSSQYERIRRIPALLVERRIGSARLRDYAASMRGLYATIQSLTGASIIVDSSKNPARALALSLVPGIELYVVHLVRDGRGVMWSYAKSFTKEAAKGIERNQPSWSSWKASFQWVLGNRLSSFVRMMIPRPSIEIRYEDFVDSPSDEVARIEDLVGVDMSSLKRDLDAAASFAVPHLLSGNRLRMIKEIQLRRDEEWREKLSVGSKAVFRLIAGRCARRHGYL